MWFVLSPFLVARLCSVSLVFTCLPVLPVSVAWVVFDYNVSE